MRGYYSTGLRFCLLKKIISSGDMIYITVLVVTIILDTKSDLKIELDVRDDDTSRSFVILENYLHYPRLFCLSI